MKISTGYEFDGRVLRVARGSFRIDGEGDWVYLFVKQPKSGWVKIAGMDSGGAQNFFSAVFGFVKATEEIIKKEEKVKNKKKKEE